MTHSQYDLVAIGTALVDVSAKATDEFIASQEPKGMKRGAMSLIDERRAVELYAAMGAGVETSGGSAGNTMAGFASFGGKGAFIGKVADDQLGNVFRHDMKAMGVHFTTQPLIVGSQTGRCLILVTPDAERTMNTFLGAGTELSEADVDADLIASSKITFLEGYLFDPPQAKKAFYKAVEIARGAGRKVSLTLSDPFCVERHRADFRDLVEKHVDILFANEHEIMSLYQVGSFDEAVKAVSNHCEIAALTRSAKGSTIVSGGKTVDVAASPVAKPVDSTGAGDQYAAGFLYGYTQGRDLATCGRLGSLAAAEVISHVGPRPAMNYADFLKKAA
jgi:sugar/nucleoside kinase (ribokinase family)